MCELNSLCKPDMQEAFYSNSKGQSPGRGGGRGGELWSCSVSSTYSTQAVSLAPCFWCWAVLIYWGTGLCVSSTPRRGSGPGSEGGVGVWRTPVTPCWCSHWAVGLYKSHIWSVQLDRSQRTSVPLCFPIQRAVGSLSSLGTWALWQVACLFWWPCYTCPALEWGMHLLNCISYNKVLNYLVHV